MSTHRNSQSRNKLFHQLNLMYSLSISLFPSVLKCLLYFTLYVCMRKWGNISVMARHFLREIEISNLLKGYKLPSPAQIACLQATLKLTNTLCTVCLMHSKKQFNTENLLDFTIKFRWGFSFTCSLLICSFSSIQTTGFPVVAIWLCCQRSHEENYTTL